MSEKKKKDEELVFHYSREQRLSAATDAVRSLNDTSPRKKTNLFRTLTANRSLAFLFLAIIMLSLTAIVTSILVPSPDEADYGGLSLSLSAFRFEGAAYVALKKTAKTSTPYIGPALLSFRFAGDEETSLSTEVLFTPAKSEEFKFKLESTGEGRVEALLEIGDKRLLLAATPH